MLIEPTITSDTDLADQYSADFYRLLLKNLPDLAVIVYSRDLRYLTVEGPLLNLLGGEPATILGQRLSERVPFALMPAEQWAKMEPLYRAVLDGQELNFNASFGNQRFYVNVLPVRDEHGAIYAGLILVQDITEDYHIEVALRASEERYRLLVENYLDAVLLASIDGLILMANEEACRLFGYSVEALCGMNYETLLDTSDPRAAEAIRASHTTGAFRGELRCQRADGSVFPVEFSSKLYRSADDVAHNLMTIRDVTLIKQAQQQALELHLQRERVRLLTEFIRDVSHDFRTPLAIIQSSAYLITRLTDPERQNDYKDKIIKQVHRLESILTDMMTMLQLDVKEDVPTFPVRINQLIRDVVLRLMPTITEQHLQVEYDLDETLPLLYGDPNDLDRALFSVIDNAVRFTPAQGQITVRSRLYHQAQPHQTPDAPADRHNMIVVEVRDTGVGIPEAELAHIFDPFFRADKARSTQSGGAGLGLPIAKRIVELHGGKIEVESIEQRGSVFRLCLPLTRYAVNRPHEDAHYR
jgi:PAS domain S-box-containing protein